MCVGKSDSSCEIEFAKEPVQAEARLQHKAPRDFPVVKKLNWFSAMTDKQRQDYNTKRRGTRATECAARKRPAGTRRDRLTSKSKSSEYAYQLGKKKATEEAAKVVAPEPSAIREAVVVEAPKQSKQSSNEQPVNTRFVGDDVRQAYEKGKKSCAKGMISKEEHESMIEAVRKEAASMASSPSSSSGMIPKQEHERKIEEVRSKAVSEAWEDASSSLSCEFERQFYKAGYKDACSQFIDDPLNFRSHAMSKVGYHPKVTEKAVDKNKLRDLRL